MIEYNAVGLLYTYKCTGTCEICGLKCGPNRNEKMDLEVAKKVIRDSAYNGIKLIGITGGEPFIYYEEILELCKLAFSLGMQTTFTTNAFWATDKDGTFEKLEKLKHYGVRSIKVSLDDFHMKHISTENYRRIFRISQMLYIKVLIGCKILKNGIGNRHVLEHFDDEMANILFCQYRAYPIGDAVKIPKELFYLSDTIRGKCNESNMLLIEPNGTVYPCGSACVMSSIRSVGNVYVDSFETILVNAKNNIYTNYIKKNGLQVLINTIRDMNPGLVDNCQYVDMCDACSKIFSYFDKKVIDDAIEKIEGKI